MQVSVPFQNFEVRIAEFKHLNESIGELDAVGLVHVAIRDVQNTQVLALVDQFIQLIDRGIDASVVLQMKFLQALGTVLTQLIKQGLQANLGVAPIEIHHSDTSLLSKCLSECHDTRVSYLLANGNKLLESHLIAFIESFGQNLGRFSTQSTV